MKKNATVKVNDKWSSRSYNSYLKARGIDAEDFCQECELIQLEHPAWPQATVRRQALRQSQRAISGNRRKRVDSQALDDKRKELPAVAEAHLQLADVWKMIPESAHAMLALAMEDSTNKLTPRAKKVIIKHLEAGCLPKAICNPTSLYCKVMQLINHKDGTHWALSDTPVPRKVKHTHYMTRQEVKQDLAMEPVSQFDQFDLTYGDYR